MLKGLPEFSSKANLNFDSIARTVGLAGINTEDDFEYVSLDAFAQYLEIASIMSGEESFGLQVRKPAGNRPDRTAFVRSRQCARRSVPPCCHCRNTYPHGSTSAMWMSFIETDRLIIDWGFSPLLVRRWQFCDYSVATSIRRVNLLTDSRWAPARRASHAASAAKSRSLPAHSRALAGLFPADEFHRASSRYSGYCESEPQRSPLHHVVSAARQDSCGSVFQTRISIPAYGKRSSWRYRVRKARNSRAWRGGRV